MQGNQQVGVYPRLRARNMMDVRNEDADLQIGGFDYLGAFGRAVRGVFNYLNWFSRENEEEEEVLRVNRELANNLVALHRRLPEGDAPLYRGALSNFFERHALQDAQYFRARQQYRQELSFWRSLFLLMFACWIIRRARLYASEIGLLEEPIFGIFNERGRLLALPPPPQNQ